MRLLTHLQNDIRSLFVLFSLFLFFQPSSFSQPLSCRDHVDLGIGANCEIEIPLLFLLEPNSSVPDSFSIEVSNAMPPVMSDTLSVYHVGQELIVTTTDLETGNSCWTELIVTNPFPPEITCTDAFIHCHQMDYLDDLVSIPAIVNPCFETSEYVFTYVDNSDNLLCEDDYAFTITRNWTVTDPNGLTGTCAQTIFGQWLTIADVIIPPNYDNVFNSAFFCSDTISFEMQTDTAVTGVPLAFGHRLENLFCEFSAIFTDVLVPLCGAGVEINRNWNLIDFCTNEVTTFTQIIQYIDVEPPVFSVPDTLRASLSSNCSVNFNLPGIDLESECSNLEVMIITPWETLSSNGGLLEFPQVEGLHILQYQVIDDCGNEAVEEVVFIIENSENLICPSDVTIECGTYFDVYQLPILSGNYSILSNFGDAEPSGNCYFNFQDSIALNVDGCGAGSFTRYMTSIDGNEPMTCEQTITVEHYSDFVVEFPEDMELTCDMGPDSYGTPIIYGDNCENIEITYSDQIFDVVPNSCYRIIREWRVVNLCQTNADTTNVVMESHEAMLAQNNLDCDLNDDNTCNDRTFRDGLNAANFPNPVPDGVIFYQQIINVSDNEAPVFVNGCDIPAICVESSTCLTDILLPTPELSACDYYTNWQVVSTLGNGFGPFPNISLGVFMVNYVAFDDCGNSSSCQSILTVEDCATPEAFCHEMLILELNAGAPCEATLFAQNLSNGSVDNCTNSLNYSFNSSMDSISTTFTYEDALALGTSEIQLFIADDNGNQSSCTSTITFNIPGTCEPNTSISGYITRSNGEGVNNAMVEISVNNNLIDAPVTQADGFYQGLVDFEGQYNLTPIKEGDNAINGVTTFDLVLLRKHILGIDPFTNPYQLLAADVNGSNSVTTLDLVNIRKLILGINSSFSVPTWRFVPANYEFTDPLNPWNFPQVLPVDAPFPVVNADFIGIKAGDLN